MRATDIQRRFKHLVGRDVEVSLFSNWVHRGKLLSLYVEVGSSGRRQTCVVLGKGQSESKHGAAYFHDDGHQINPAAVQHIATCEVGNG